jgi:hypothetical protein
VGFASESPRLQGYFAVEPTIKPSGGLISVSEHFYGNKKRLIADEIDDQP